MGKTSENQNYEVIFTVKSLSHGDCKCIISAFFFQGKLRLEMEMERLRQTHSKEIESKDDEVEEIRQSCSKKVYCMHTFLYCYSSFPLFFVLQS